MNHNLEYGKMLENSFEKTLKSLKEMASIIGTDIKDEKIKQSLQEMNVSIEESTKDTVEGIKKLKRNMIWGEVHIGLLGETNAGKSTLIEAITRGNGQTIGTGEKDFTKEASFVEYEDKVLIDLPGIEGDEGLYVDEIEKGINKAHYLFYVSSNAKEPDETTLEKVKGYLKEQTNIYSIINIRGSRFKDNLVNENTEIVIERTDEKFKKAFGSHYKGIIPVHANAAFSLRTHNKSSERVEQTKRKLLEKFGDDEVAYRYTNISEVIKAIKTADSKEVIIANTYKFFNLIESIVADILKSKKGLDGQLKSIEKEFEKAKESVATDVESFEKILLRVANIEIEKFKNNIKKIIDDAEENGWDEKEIENQIKSNKEKFKKQMESQFRKEFEELQQRIKRNYKEMSNQISLSVKYIEFDKGFINIEDLLKGFTIDFKYILKAIFDIAISALAGLINPIAGIINVSTTTIIKLFKWFSVDKKKIDNKRKTEAYQNVDEKIKLMEGELNRKLKGYVKDLERSIRKEDEKLEIYVQRLRTVSWNLTKQINKITDIKSDVSKELIKCIEEINVEFAYIDYKLKNMFCVGGYLKHKELYNLKYIHSFKDIGEFYHFYQNRIKDGFIYLDPKQEFQKRAISAFLNYLKKKYNSFDIKGVRREYNEY